MSGKDGMRRRGIAFMDVERMCKKCIRSGLLSPTFMAVRNWGRVVLRCISCVRQEYVSSL